MERIDFHPLTIADKEVVQHFVHDTECRNCDLNFVNLLSWRFLYDTEVAVHRGWLVFRFKANGHRAYLAPVGTGNYISDVRQGICTQTARRCQWSCIVKELLNDAEADGEPFLLLGTTEESLSLLNRAMPGYFYATCDRTYTDYIYKRENLTTLAGKSLQPKRNHANRFFRTYPGAVFRALQQSDIPACLSLMRQWAAAREEEKARLTHDNEYRSVETVFRHWDELEALGGVMEVDGRIVAFTYGAPINYDTFDVCVEKADTGYDGIYAAINREFARSLPTCYTLINREEDLGIEGLRRAKESYHPYLLLHKYTVMAKHPMGKGQTQKQREHSAQR